MQFLEQLRSKQSHVKSQIAFVSAIATTGIIALVWLSTLPAQFSKVSEQIAKEGESQTATAGNAIDDLIAGATKSLDGLNDGEEQGADVPEPEGMVPQDSALNNLAGWRTEAEMNRFAPSSTTPEQPYVIKEMSTPTPTQPTVYNQGIQQPPTETPAPTPTPTPLPAQPVVAPVPTEPVVTQPEVVSKPTVILIGTTTKKTE